MGGSRKPKAEVAPASAWTTQCLTRLAKAFNMDAEALMVVFQGHHRGAQVPTHQRPHEPASAIWQRTLRRTQERWQMRERWPAKALLPVAQRFLVAPGSTSGVEQALSQFKRLMGEQWHGSPVAEERRLVLQLKATAEPKPPPELLKAARRTWAECFGKARASGTERTPSLGMRSSRRFKRKATEALRGASSATRRLAKRREEVEAKASKLPGSRGAPSGRPCNLDATTRAGTSAPARGAPRAGLRCSGRGHS